MFTVQRTMMRFFFSFIVLSVLLPKISNKTSFFALAQYEDESQDEQLGILITLISSINLSNDINRCIGGSVNFRFIQWYQGIQKHRWNW